MCLEVEKTGRELCTSSTLPRVIVTGGKMTEVCNAVDLFGFGPPSIPS